MKTAIQCDIELITENVTNIFSTKLRNITLKQIKYKHELLKFL